MQKVRSAESAKQERKSLGEAGPYRTGAASPRGQKKKLKKKQRIGRKRRCEIRDLSELQIRTEDTC